MHRRLIGGAVVLLLAGLIVAIGAVGSTAGGAQRYLVVYKGSNVKGDAAARIEQAGGTLVYSYDQIGVAVASSSSDSFRSDLLKVDKLRRECGADCAVRDAA
jgi:lantibiotic leader peptide-processing serine protease